MQLKLFLFQEHTGRVFRLQFDEFQIVSSSHDDTILIWDFLNSPPDPKGCGSKETAPRSPSRKFNFRLIKLIPCLKVFIYFQHFPPMNESL